MEFKKFKGPKSIELIRAQCVLQQLVCDSTLFDQGKSDLIIVFSPATPQAKVFYTDLSGYFFGHTDQGVAFSSDDPLDGTPWFDALLAFFNEPLPAGEAPDAAATSTAVDQMHDQAFAAAQDVPAERLAAAQAVISAGVIAGTEFSALEKDAAEALNG